MVLLLSHFHGSCHSPHLLMIFTSCHFSQPFALVTRQTSSWPTQVASLPSQFRTSALQPPCPNVIGLRSLITAFYITSSSNPSTSTTRHLPSASISFFEQLTRHGPLFQSLVCKYPQLLFPFLHPSHSLIKISTLDEPHRLPSLHYTNPTALAKVTQACFHLNW